MKKSVLILVQNLPVPDDRRIWMEATALREADYRVSVISPRRADQPKREELDGIMLYRYLMAPQSSGYLSYWREYAYSFLMTTYLSWKIFFTRGFSIIHTANPPDFFFLIALPFKLLGVKFVYDQHDLMPEMLLARFGKSPEHWLYKLLLLFERLSYASCDLHIATCRSGQTKTLSRVRPADKNVIVRSAPDRKNVINRRLIQLELAAQVKQRYSYLCSYLGVMGPQDGVDKLLRSIKLIVKDAGRTDIGFVLMGHGDDFNHLKRLAEEYQVTDNVIFTDWADASIISTYLFSSDLGLMPEPKNDYTDNSLHNKILEYMSARLPVVTYDLKEARSTAGSAAVYVPNNDEQQFAKTIIELIDDQERRRQMSRVASERAELPEFSRSTAQAALVRAYDSLLR